MKKYKNLDGEIWKPFKTFTESSMSQYHVAGDTYYVSNKGRYRMNDILLTKKFGLTISTSEDLSSLVSIPHHNEIYNMFVGDIPKGHCIHHIDHDHTNNSIDNLLLMDEREHGALHFAEGNYKQHLTSDFMYYFNVDAFKDKSWYSLLDYYIENYDKIEDMHLSNRTTSKKSLEKYKIFLRERVDNIKEAKRAARQAAKLDKQKQHELLVKHNIEAGIWKIDKNGRVCAAQTKLKGRKLSADHKNKIRNALLTFFNH